MQGWLQCWWPAANRRPAQPLITQSVWITANHAGLAHTTTHTWQLFVCGLANFFITLCIARHLISGDHSCWKWPQMALGSQIWRLWSDTEQQGDGLSHAGCARLPHAPFALTVFLVCVCFSFWDRAYISSLSSWLIKKHTWFILWKQTNRNTSENMNGPDFSSSNCVETAKRDATTGTGFIIILLLLLLLSGSITGF